MADTLIESDDEERPPPTLRDPEMPPPEPPPGQEGAARARRIGIAVTVIAALLVTGAVGFYLFFFRYEALPRRHVPSNANLVARVAVAEIALWKPVRSEIFSFLLEEAGKGKPRGDRIRAATGVDLATDLREVVVASLDASSWVILAGGRLRRGHFVDGMEEVARQEGWAGVHREGELLVVPGGIAIGQAEDGTIVVGTDAQIALAALPASDEPRRVEVPEEGAVSFAVTREAWAGAAGLARIAGAGTLDRVKLAHGRMSLGDAPELFMSLEPAAGVDTAALARELNSLIGTAKLVTLLLPDVAGEKGALQGAVASAEGDHVEIHAPWPYEGLERGVQRLGAVIRALR